LLVPPIRPPSVPDKASRLRLSLSYGHTPEMIARLVAALGKLRG
jgi:7-keto-8-aminopelargonate synthetase-like enzyme